MFKNPVLFAENTPAGLTVIFLKLHTDLIDNYSANMYLKEICFQTSERNGLCDLFCGTFLFILDWYTNSTQKFHFQWGFLVLKIAKRSQKLKCHTGE